jgi:AraC-like DNA-binding protein/quercetin dioxygenase-like cupin family protein
MAKVTFKPDHIEISHLLDATTDNKFVGLTVFDSKLDVSESIYNRPFRSIHFSIILVKKGQLSVSIDLNRFLLDEKDLLIIPPSAIRIFELQKPETELISLLFTADFLLQAGLHIKYYPRFSLGEKAVHSNLSLSLNEFGVVSSQLHLIRLLLKRSDVPKKKNENIYLPIFQSTIKEVNLLFDGQQPTVNESSHIIQRFFDCLTKYHTLQREVSFYASALGIHEKYLSQVLKEKTGRTARSYIIQMVILEAKVLLDRPDLSIQQIADEMHFTNPFHFSRFFKKYTTLTPSAYRNQSAGVLIKGRP